MIVSDSHSSDIEEMINLRHPVRHSSDMLVTVDLQTDEVAIAKSVTDINQTVTCFRLGL